MNDFEDIEIDFEDGTMTVVEPAQEQPKITPAEVGQPEDNGQQPISFLSYLASTREDEYRRLFDFALDTLQFANKVHIYHWTCEKGFYHTQFEEIYNLLRDFADKLVETTLAYSKGKFTFLTKNYAQQPVDFNIETAIAKLEEYREVADGTSKSVEANRSINAIFDDLIADLDKHIGLLKNFQ